MKIIFEIIITMLLVISAQVGSSSSAKEEFNQLKDSCFRHHEGEGGLEKKCQKGLGLAEEILKTDPDNIEVLFKYSMLLDKTDRRPEAIKIWESILRLDPNHTDSLYKLALDAYPKDYKRKVEILKRVVKLEPNHPESHQILAIYLLELGDGENAAQEMIKHIQLINRGVDLPWIRVQTLAIADSMGSKGFTQELSDVLITYLSVFKGGELNCFDVKNSQKRFSLKSKKLDESLKEFCGEKEKK